MKVSVLMCAFNGGDFLEDTLQSILCQSFSEFELLVIDDASTDQTGQILESFAKRDSRLQVQTHSKNTGVGRCLRELLERAQGEYVALIGHDDLWHSPQFLEKHLAFLTESTTFTAAFCAPKIIDQRGNPYKGYHPFDVDALKGLSHPKLVLRLFQGNFLCASASLFRRKALDHWELLGDLDFLQDWGLWLHLALAGPFGFVEESMASYRIHGNNLSFHNKNPLQELHERKICRYQFFADPNFAIFSQKYSETLGDLFQFFIDSEGSEALRLLELALRAQPLHIQALSPIQDALGIAAWNVGALSLATRLLRDNQVPKLCPGTHSTWVVLWNSHPQPLVYSLPGNLLTSYPFGNLVLLNLRGIGPHFPRLAWGVGNRVVPLLKTAENALFQTGTLGIFRKRRIIRKAFEKCWKLLWHQNTK